MFRRSCAAGGLICALLLGVGCERSAEQAPAAETAPKRTFGRTLRQPQREPVTFEECQAFAVALQGAILERDAASAAALFDLDTMLSLAARGRDVPVEYQEEFTQLSLENIKRGGGPIGRLMTEIHRGGRCEIVRPQFEPSGIANLWFRLISAEHALGYYSFRLARGPDGKVRAQDVYDSWLGDYYSITLHPAVAQRLCELGCYRHEDQDALAQRMRGLSQVGQMRQHIVAGNDRAALAVYKQLPEQLQTAKFVLAMRLACVESIRGEEQLAAVRDAEKQNSPPGSLDPIMIRHYHSLGMHREKIISLDRINRMVGGDLTLSAARVSALLAAGRLAEARSSAAVLIAVAPATLAHYELAMRVAHRQQDFARMIDLLEALELRGVEMPNYYDSPMYADLVRSPEFQAWQRDQRLAMQPRPPGDDRAPSDFAPLDASSGDEPPLDSAGGEYSAWPRTP